MEPLDGLRVVDYNDVWVVQRQLVELVGPVGVVEFVDDAIEGSLLGQRLGGIDSDEINALLFAVGNERARNEGFFLLGRQSIAYAVPWTWTWRWRWRWRWIGHFCLGSEKNKREKPLTRSQRHFNHVYCLETYPREMETVMR